MDPFTWLAFFAVMIGLHLALGRIISQEQWWGDTRDTFEDWCYIDGNAVRQGLPTADMFWARAKPWAPLGWGLDNDGGFELVQTRKRYSLLPDGDHRKLLFKPKPLWIRFCTAARTKVADWVGCSHCSPFIPSFVLLALATWFTGHDWWTWKTLLTNVAAWGVATEYRSHD